MDITLDNKRYLLSELELLKTDLNNCKSNKSISSIKSIIKSYENELKKYKKPILINPPYNDTNTIYELKYVDFTDEELLSEGFVMNYLEHMTELLDEITEKYQTKIK